MNIKKVLCLFSVLAASAFLFIQPGGSAVCFAASETGQPAQEAAVEGQEKKDENKSPFPESYEWEIQSNKTKGWPQGPKVSAETAIVMDIDSGEILYAKGIDERRAPASTTKIMTAMLAIEKVPLDTKITFTDEVNNIEAGSTHIGIKPGETLTMKDSLYGILLASANEVSSGVAEYIGKTVQGFVAMMNQRAKDLGCKNTHFVNANGLYDEDHYTTARDLAVIACAAFENETFRNIIKEEYYIIPPTNITPEQRWLNNHHKMLVSGAQHYDGCLGGKPGYTVKAGNTLVTYAERNNMRLVCVVLADNLYHYDDTKALLDYGFDNFQKIPLASYEQLAFQPGTFEHFLTEQHLVPEAVQDTSLLLPKQAEQSLTCEAKLQGSTLNMDYYYGDFLLYSESKEASPALIAAKQQTEAEKAQEESAPAKSAEEPEEIQASAKTKADTPALGGFFEDLTAYFQELPSWKYPALLLLAGSLIFYIVLLTIRIRRGRRKKRRKHKRK